MGDPDAGDDGGGGGDDGGPTSDGGSDGGSDAAPDADSGSGCLTECDPDHCGAVPDNCGDFLSCPQCDGPFEVCGLDAPNRCGVPPAECTPPMTEQEACAGRCGTVSDGCEGVYTCNASNGGLVCAQDQQCGGFTGNPAEDGQCINQPACQPRTCAEALAQCGVIGDGCSGTLDCTALTGGCTNGQVCGTGMNSNRCVAEETPCEPLTEAQACNGTCGIVGDGCGDQIVCPACPDTQTCGGGGTPGVCGSGAGSCTPFDEMTVCMGKCGQLSDGCGGVYTCGASNSGDVCDPNAGESCGGGGVPNECGAPPCTPISMAAACPVVGGHPSCGQVANGCGGLVNCGACPGNEICGLTVANVCADPPTCTPIAVATACSGKCGSVPDGCGGMYTCSGVNGGVTCVAPQYCGATTPNTCGTPPQTCTPQTCQSLGHTCGMAGDGCGNVLNCWPQGQTTCPDPQTQACVAGNGGAQSCQTGTGGCVGSLCDDLPTCSPGSPTRITGTVRTPGLGMINRIAVPNAIVYIPANPGTTLPAVQEGVTVGDPLSCGRCADDLLVAEGESVLASAVTDDEGFFELEGRIPVGTAFNLVVKIGKWRRVVQVPAGITTACNSVSLGFDYTRLAANSTDGLVGTHLPKIAISTGDIDEMECVFRNIGISESEFTVPSGNGRIHMYRGDGARMRSCGGSYISSCTGTYFDGFTRQCNATRNGTANFGCVNNRTGCTTQTAQCTATSSGTANFGCVNSRPGCTWTDVSVDEAPLYDTAGRANQYDMLVFDCQGSAAHHDSLTTTQNERIETYVNNGGRLFASHWEYRWIIDNDSLVGSSNWQAGGSDDSDTAYVSLGAGDMGQAVRAGANPAKSRIFRDWLNAQGALTSLTPPTLTITDARDLAGTAVNPGTDEWVYRYDGSSSDPANARVQQLSFNTPFGAGEDDVCGRVAYSGFHVSGADNSGNVFFPNVCSNAELTSQEKILVFMLFDLNSCVSDDPPAPPQCTPKTGAELCPTENSACGALSDGCGGVVNCGGCDPGFYCNGTTCAPQNCTPATCASLGYNCGTAPNGCNGTLNCGTCGENQVCNLGGPGQCGSSSCTPLPFNTQCPPNSCGQVADGCGGTYNCGTCPGGQVCGGSSPNRCGAGSCTQIPFNLACMGRNCGLVADGCGGTYSCGACTAPDSCGGAGVPNVCGHPVCTPLDTATACQGRECGWASDGCGGAISCGTCPNGGACGGAGPGLCGAGCTPTTCAAQNAECGAISNLCNGVIECGSCPAGETCGADGPNRCGAATCMPRDCAAANAECGQVGDGCGGVLNCGVCTAPESCGGAGVANQCGIGTGGCTPGTCPVGVECGAASDGCGGVLNCGGCGPGKSCSNGICIGIE